MIQVIGDRILVALPPDAEETTTSSGLVLVRDPDRLKTPTQGIVVQLGEKSHSISVDAWTGFIVDAVNEGHHDSVTFEMLGEWVKQQAPAPFDVAVGDCVLFPQSAGEELSLNGVNYVILREEDILGIVEKETAA